MEIFYETNQYLPNIRKLESIFYFKPILFLEARVYKFSKGR